MIFACRRSLRIRACSAADDGERTGDSILYSSGNWLDPDGGSSRDYNIWSENSTSHMSAPLSRVLKQNKIKIKVKRRLYLISPCSQTRSFAYMPIVLCTLYIYSCAMYSSKYRYMYLRVCALVVWLHNPDPHMYRVWQLVIEHMQVPVLVPRRLPHLDLFFR